MHDTYLLVVNVLAYMGLPIGALLLAMLVVFLVLAYTTAVELDAKFITKLNSNGYTSKAEYNVRSKALRFQIVHYYLYHEGIFSQVVHGVTLLADYVLWTDFFHCLFSGNIIYSHICMLIPCVMQTITFHDNRLKIILVVVHVLGAAISAAVYYWALPLVGDWMIGIIALCLLFNALMRVASHTFESLPIGFLTLDNKTPIRDWWNNKLIFNYVYHRMATPVVAGIVSELQAGIPLRLFTACVAILLTKLEYDVTGINMDELRERANLIDIYGWKGDPESEEIFSDKEVQYLFALEAAIKWNNRSPAEKKNLKTWLHEKEETKADLKKHYGITVKDYKKERLGGIWETWSQIAELFGIDPYLFGGHEEQDVEELNEVPAAKKTKNSKKKHTKKAHHTLRMKNFEHNIRHHPRRSTASPHSKGFKVRM